MIRIELNDEQKSVIKIIREAKSLPFLELTSLSAIQDNRLTEILVELEKKDLVKVVNRGNIFDEIVVAKNNAFNLF